MKKTYLHVFTFIGETKCKVSLSKCVQEERRLLSEQSNKIPLKNSYLLSYWMPVGAQSLVSSWMKPSHKEEKTDACLTRSEKSVCRGSETVRTEKKMRCTVYQDTPPVWSSRTDCKAWLGGEKDVLILSTLNKECGVRRQSNRQVKQLGREGEWNVWQLLCSA